MPGCDTIHAQMFSQNLMTLSFWNSNVLCYFTNGQTTIGTNHFPTFWIFSSFFDIVGPKRSLSSVEVQPSFKKRLYHWWVCVILTASSPNACFNFLCLWFRASLICINDCPTRCDTKHSFYYSANSLYMFRVSTTPIMSTQNCNYSLRYWSYFLCSLASLEGGSRTKNMTSTGGCSYSFVYSWWVWLMLKKSPSKQDTYSLW